MLPARPLGKNFALCTRASRQLFVSSSSSPLRTTLAATNIRRFQSTSPDATPAAAVADTPQSVNLDQRAAKQHRPMRAQFVEIKALLFQSHHTTNTPENMARLWRFSELYQELLQLKPVEKEENPNQQDDDQDDQGEFEDAEKATSEAPTQPDDKLANPIELPLPRPKTREEFSSLLNLFAFLLQKRAGVAWVSRLKEKGVRLRFIDYHNLIQLYSLAHEKPTVDEANEATAMVDEMVRAGTMRPSTYPSLLNVYARVGFHELALLTFRKMEELQDERAVDARSYNILIYMYAKANSHVEAEMLWREMRSKEGKYPSLPASRAMIQMYARLENIPAQVEIMEYLRERVKEPNQDLCNLYLSVCARSGQWRLGLDILAELRQRQAALDTRGIQDRYATDEWRETLDLRTESQLIGLFTKLNPEERVQAVVYLQSLIEEKGLARDVLFDCIITKYLNESASASIKDTHE